MTQINSCIYLGVALVVFGGVCGAREGRAQSAREDYSVLARVCYPMARKVDRSRVCPLDTGNIAPLQQVARNGAGTMKSLAQEILDLAASNAITAEEIAEHEKSLVLNVATGVFAETKKDLAGALIEGASDSRKLEVARAKIQKRQTQIDVLVNEKLPRAAAEISGPKSRSSLLFVHPFYRDLAVTRPATRAGAATSVPAGVQHFQVDLRNDGEVDLHRVTVQLEMRDAQDRIETYLGFWDVIASGEVVPLCTWKFGSRHTDHYAGCAISLGAKTHFVRYSLKVWADEGRSDLLDQEFEHQRVRTDLVAYERETEEAAKRKVRQADAKRRAEVTLASKPGGKVETPKQTANIAADDDEVTEPFLADFTAGTDEEPDGWSPLEGKRPLVINRNAGAPFLTTQTNVVSASQSPLLTIRGDFFLEFSVLSTDNLADGAGNLTATLEGRDGVPPLALTIQKNDKGFAFTVTGADEESRSAGLGGRKPHKVRLERQDTAHRILVDGKVVLKYAAGDAPDYDVMKLALGNYGLRVYRIQVGPLKK